MLRLLLAILTGLVGAALLHIFIILVLPLYTGTDIWSKTTSLDADFEFYLLPDKIAGADLYNDDPNVQLAICTFDIENGPLQIFAERPANLWTFSIFGKDGSEIYSMSRRSSIDGQVNILVLTPTQLLVLKSQEPDLVAKTVSVEMPDIEGFAVLRYITPSHSELSEARAFLTGAQCLPL